MSSERYLMRLSLTLIFAVALAGPALAGAGVPCGVGSSHAIPEPAALTLLGLGVSGILAARKRFGRKK